MGPKTEELVNEFDQCASMLRSCSEMHWAKWLEKSATLLRKGQFNGIEHFEGAFGGMGSINDLVLHPINGHTIKESDVNNYNEKMKKHFSKAHQIIKEIRKNAVYE